MLKQLVFGLVVVLGFMLQACSPKSQDECGFVQNVYGERISWKADVPVVMHLHKNFPEGFVEAAKNAAETWNRTVGRQVIQISPERYTGPEQTQKDNVNVIYFYSTWEADRTTEQARTSVYWVGDQIKEADIRINDKDFNFYWQKSNKSDEINIEALLIHEMGHVLGLKHKDLGNSVMATYLASNTNRVDLAETDKDSLKCEY